MRRIDNKKITLLLDREIKELPENLRAQGWEKLDDHRLSITYQPSQIAVSNLLRVVQMNGFSIIDLTTEETDLEDIFLQLTQQKVA